MGRKIAAVAAANAIVLISAVAVAASPAKHDSSAQACVSKSGALALLSKGKCDQGQKAITLNQRGPRGPRGPSGSSAVSLNYVAASTGTSKPVPIPGTGISMNAACLVSGGEGNTTFSLNGPADYLETRGTGATQIENGAYLTFPDGTYSNGSGGDFSWYNTSQHHLVWTTSAQNSGAFQFVEYSATMLVASDEKPLFTVSVAIDATGYSCNVWAQAVPSG